MSAEPGVSRGLSETQILLLGALSAGGAWLGQSGHLRGGAALGHGALGHGALGHDALGWPVLAALVVGVILALIRGAPALVITTVVILSVALGVRADEHYQVLDASSYSGPAELVTDPKPSRSGWRAEVRLEGGERVIVSGAGFAADPLGRRQAGEHIWIEGTIRPVPDRGWYRSRHIVGQLSLSEVHYRAGSAWFWQPSNGLRSMVQRSADFLAEEHQDLYLGLVIGDDRFQPRSQRAQFRAAGLSHLLAVSGQNVAFVLAVIAPVVRRLGVNGRVGVIAVVLVVFALATRMEPSVLRATCVAGVATVSVALGRRSTGLRTLGLASTMLVLVDPMLVNSVGFGLSVSASVGILALGPAIKNRLVGPTPFVEAFAITVAAQLGVSPLLVAIFGPMSLVALPANLLVGWAAGLIMTWGLTGGLAIGCLAWALPAPIAQVAQQPVGWLVWWIDAVASWASRAPAPRVGGPGMALLAALVLGAWWFRTRLVTAGPVVWTVGLFMGLSLASSATPTPPRGHTELVGGGHWFVADGGQTILIVSSGADDRLVDSLVTHRITSIDLVILERGGRLVSGLFRELDEVSDVGAAFAPTNHRVTGATRLLVDLELELEDGRQLIIESGKDRLVVEAMARDGSR